jgi:hypothetical protein
MAAKMTGIAKAKRASTALRDFKRKTEAQRVPNALVSAAAMAGGAAVSGALEAAIGDEIAGMPTGLVGSIFAIGLGLGLGEPWIIYAGAGMAANMIHSETYDAVSDFYTPKTPVNLKEASN